MVADTNKDGAIDMDEVVAVWDKLGPKEKPTTEVKIDRPFIQENFDKFDTDHNKKIDLKEFRALLTDKVTKMLEDANTSGKPLPF
jgi:Ca2+-binding EF-hand superfamily protein